MIVGRRQVCFALLLVGAIGLIWGSGIAFWLALGLVAIGLVGVLPLVQELGPVALVMASVSIGLTLVEATLWVFEKAASGPLPAIEAGPVPLAPELPPEIKTKSAHAKRRGDAIDLAKA